MRLVIVVSILKPQTPNRPYIHTHQVESIILSLTVLVLYSKVNDDVHDDADDDDDRDDDDDDDADDAAGDDDDDDNDDAADDDDDDDDEDDKHYNHDAHINNYSNNKQLSK